MVVNKSTYPVIPLNKKTFYCLFLLCVKNFLNVIF